MALIISRLCISGRKEAGTAASSCIDMHGHVQDRNHGRGSGKSQPGLFAWPRGVLRSGDRLADYAGGCIEIKGLRFRAATIVPFINRVCLR